MQKASTSYLSATNSTTHGDAMRWLHRRGRAVVLCLYGLAAATTAMYAHGAETLKIGQTATLTGPLSGLGNGVNAGLQAHIREVNVSGGISGRQLQLIQLDDGYSEEQAERNVARLANEGAIALLMPIGTSPALGAMRAAAAHELPIVGAFTGAEATRKYSPITFLLRASFKDELEHIVQHVLTVGVSEIVVVHNANPGATLGVEHVKGALERAGQRLVGSVAVKDDASDVEAAVTMLNSLRPKAVVFSSSTHVAAEVLKRFKPGAPSTQFLAYSFVDGQAVAARIGPLATGLVVSQVVPDPWNAASRLAQQYRAAMTAAGTAELSYQSFEGYITARVLTEALRRAGATPTPNRVRAALTGSGTFAFGDLRIEFSDRRNIGRQQVEMTMISRDGRYVR